MPDPVHAVIREGVIVGRPLMDVATAHLFRDLGFVEMLWPGGTLIDITDLDPQPQIGWTHHPHTAHPWRPPAPDPSYAWDDATGSWTEPAPAPESEPESEPTPEPKQSQQDPDPATP